MEPWMWIVAVVVLLVIAGVLVRSLSPKRPEPLSPTTASAAPATTAIPIARTDGTLDPAVAAEIDRLVATDQKIAAIKVLRDHQPLSLQEAKDRVDAWIPGSAPRPASVAPGGFSADSLPPTTRAEIDRLVATGQPIAAIKILREATGLGLKESKGVIDAWR
ncbi:MULTISPECIES: hypothetical protein [unclassified Microbacterium]|uniref:hypothetical protein n=1 Tax=unclassified Microbacterium TaxID=2609290 RepID=UPI00301001C1